MRRGEATHAGDGLRRHAQPRQFGRAAAHAAPAFPPCPPDAAFAAPSSRAQTLRARAAENWSWRCCKRAAEPARAGHSLPGARPPPPTIPTTRTRNAAIMPKARPIGTPPQPRAVIFCDEGRPERVSRFRLRRRPCIPLHRASALRKAGNIDFPAFLPMFGPSELAANTGYARLGRCESAPFQERATTQVTTSGAEAGTSEVIDNPNVSSSEVLPRRRRF